MDGFHGPSVRDSNNTKKLGEMVKKKRRKIVLAKDCAEELREELPYERPWRKVGPFDSMIVHGKQVLKPADPIVRAYDQKPDFEKDEALVMEEEMWDHLFCNSYRLEGNKLVLDNRHVCGVPMKHVDLTLWPQAQGIWPVDMMRRYRDNWVTVKLSKCSITDDVLFTSVLTNGIRHLDLGQCSLITDHGLEAIGRICGNNIKSLDISHCCLITDDGLASIASSCTKLETLGLENCPNITDRGVSAVLTHMKHLKRLSLRGNKNHIRGTGSLTMPTLDQPVMLLVHHQLVELDLSNCFEMNDDGMRWISESILYLEQLDISNCVRVTNQGISFCKVFQETLKVFKCSGVRKLDDSIAISTLMHMAKLETLHCNNLPLLTNRFVEIIYSCCHSLRELELSKAKLFSPPRNGNITLVSRLSLANVAGLIHLDGCRHLVDVNLTRCLTLTDEILRDFLNDSRETLRYLDISYCENLFRATKLNMAMQLRSVNVSGLTFLGDDNLDWLINDKHTVSLRICDNPNVVALSSCCANLTTLDAMNCTNLDMEKVHKICKFLAKPVEFRSLYRKRYALETKSARLIQKSFRRFQKAVFFTFQYILIRFRLLTPIAATHMQRLWRGHVVPHHRELLRRFVAFQRIVKRRLFLKHFNRHMEFFKSQWNAARQFQALFRGFIYRLRNDDGIMEYLRMMSYRRKFKPISYEATLKSYEYGVFRRSVIRAYHIDATLNRQAPIYEIGVILEPARAMIALRKQLFVELLCVVHERELEKERARRDHARLREQFYHVSAVRLQRWFRHRQETMVKAKRERQKEAPKGLVRFQAQIRGYFVRTRPTSQRIEWNMNAIPKLMQALHDLFKAQQEQLDDFDKLNNMRDLHGTMEQAYKHPVVPIEAAKFEFHSNMTQCVMLCMTISERFNSNYVKRMRLHSESSDRLMNDLSWFHGTLKKGEKFKRDLQKRLRLLGEKRHGYDASQDAKLRSVARTDDAQKIQAAMDIEKTWIDDVLKTLDPILEENRTILYQFSQSEMRRLNYEFQVQDEIMQLHDLVVNEGMKDEWHLRKQLLSTKIQQARVVEVDQRYHVKLLAQERYVRDRIAKTQQSNGKDSSKFFEYCSKPRIAATVILPNQKRKIEKRIKRIRKEFLTQAWSALVPVDLVKPEEYARRQRELALARSRIQNLEIEKQESEEREKRMREEKERELEMLRQYKGGEDEDEEEADLMEEIFAEAREEFLAKENGQSRLKRLENFVSMFRSERYKKRLLIMRSILEKQRDSVGFSQAICDIIITVGESELKAMKIATKRERKEGRITYTRIEPNLAGAFQTKEPVYFWTKPSIRLRDQIRSIHIQTGVRPKHKDKNDDDDDDEPVRLNRYEQAEEAVLKIADLMKPPKYYSATTEYRHEKLPNFVLEVDREDGNVEDGIVELRLGSRKEDEERFKRRGFKKIDKEIRCMEHPDRIRDRFYLWYMTIEKDNEYKAGSLESLLKQKMDLEEMIGSSPTANAKLEQLLRECEMDIKEYELSRTKGNTGVMVEKGSLQDIAELLGLNKKDLKKLTACFAAMDTDQIGQVTVDQLAYYIGLDMSEPMEKIFQFFDNSGDGTLDFEELINALCTFCMFGAREVVQLVFRWFDNANDGKLNRADFKRLVIMLHGLDPEDHRDIKRVMTYLDETCSGYITFDTFYDIYQRYPLVFQPVFDIQFAMCKAFLGKFWWETRKLDFQVARKMLKAQYAQERTKFQRIRLRRLRQDNGVKSAFATMKERMVTDMKSFKVKNVTARFEKGDGGGDDDDEESDYDQNA